MLRSPPARRAWVVVAVALIAAASLSGPAPIPGATRAQPGQSSPRLPAALARQRLFFADSGGGTVVARADGTTVADLNQIGGTGGAPLVTADGFAVFTHGNTAYRVSAGGTAAPVGRASSLFPGADGSVGLEVDTTGKPASVSYVALDGAVPFASTLSMPLPPGTSAVAQLTDGLLVVHSYSHPRVVPYEVIGAHSTVNLAGDFSVIGTHGSGAAGLHCGQDQVVYCPLRLTDTATGTQRAVPTPAGFAGFVQGGGFSPDGSLLAAFVYAPGAGTARLAVIRTRDVNVSVVGPPLGVGQGGGSATWSRDGRWVYFCGITGGLYAEETTPRGADGAPWALPLPSSYAVVGL